MKIGYYLAFLLVFAFMASAFQFKPEQNLQKTQVKRILGVGIFIKCTPVRSYDTLYTLKTKVKIESYPGTSTSNTVVGINGAINDLVHKANRINKIYDRKIRKNKKTTLKRIDAIITNNAQTAIAISWKDISKINDYDHGSVDSQNEIKYFIRNEPLYKYKKLFFAEIPSKLNFSFIGYGELSVMLTKLNVEIKKVADSLLVKPDGFITENGYSGYAIEFVK